MRILLAEDDKRMAGIVKRALSSQSLAVDVAADGEKALHLASYNDYDVILLDVILPKIGGIQVCHELREKGVKTPIIMLSAKGAVVDKIHGLDSGADDYLPKPFSLSELMARIRAVSRRKEVFRKPELKYGDVEIDTNTRIVTRKGTPIDVTPKEYRLLEFLIKHPEKVLSRFDLLENVWGAGDGYFSNVVDVHMSHLRRKLNRGFEKKLIRTVRGGGYILE